MQEWINLIYGRYKGLVLSGMDKPRGEKLENALNVLNAFLEIIKPTCLRCVSVHFPHCRRETGNNVRTDSPSNIFCSCSWNGLNGTVVEMVKEHGRTNNLKIVHYHVFIMNVCFCNSEGSKIIETMYWSIIVCVNLWFLVLTLWFYMSGV